MFIFLFLIKQNIGIIDNLIILFGFVIEKNIFKCYIEFSLIIFFHEAE